VLQPSDRCTIMYAPTWEGEADGTNYSSLDLFGPEVVRAVLALPKVRVVYRPHPQSLTSTSESVQESHAEIVRMLDEATVADPAAGHVVDSRSDVLGLCLSVDLLVTDISSVAYDFLYLRTAWPIVLADRRADPIALRASSPLAACVPVVDEANVAGLTAVLARQLVVDEHRCEREQVRELYYDGVVPGESTIRFLAAIRASMDAARAAPAPDTSSPHAANGPR
jgi:CDP-glycerol glycerophosphotransferase (TagB/SpsB family)